MTVAEARALAGWGAGASRAFLLACLAAATPGQEGAREVLESWPDGSVRARYTLNAEGRRHGPFASWHATGGREVRTRYNDGVLNGAFDSWYENGERRLEAGYVEGVLSGSYREGWEDGELEYEGRYKGGLAEGRFELTRGREKLLTQRWKRGQLLELNGLEPYPRPLDELRASLESIAASGEPAEGAELADLEAQRRATLARLKAYRYLCGVPWQGLARDPKQEAHAQAAAELCERIGETNHRPDNPGMPADEFRFASEGTRSSNLYRGRSLLDSIDSYMEDSDERNIDRVGHRRWCLNPQMGRTGFGRAGRYAAMWAFDKSGGGSHREPVLYPPPGHVPLDMFGARHAWSVLLPSGRGRQQRLDELEISIQPLDQRYLPLGSPLSLDHLGLSEGMLIFRPAGLSVEDGARYLVELEGLPGKGADARLCWLVHFVD